MEESKLLEILNTLKNDEDNHEVIEKIENAIAKGDYNTALTYINEMQQNQFFKSGNDDKIYLNTDNINELTDEQTKQIQASLPGKKQKEEEQENLDEFPFEFIFEDDEPDDDTDTSNVSEMFDDTSDNVIDYPPELQDEKLEETYLGLIISNPKNLALYSIPLEINYFQSNSLNKLYKLMIFGEGHQYCPEKSKRGYNFTKENEKIIIQKNDIKERYQNRNFNIAKVYNDLIKLFILRKYYLKNPIEDIQKELVKIRSYALYEKMSPQEIENAIDQVCITQKFKKSVLNSHITNFLINNENNLKTGLKIPFEILSDAFKGIRKGETLSIAMPSNAGKSRLTTFLCAYIASVYKKKVLLISNEMSEEKMKLCLLTTIINNPAIQKIHGKQVHISESEILDFKFRPNEGAVCEVDEDGYVLKRKGEKQFDFANRLVEISDTFKKITEITHWFENEVSNQIYFINITDHTMEELRKVISNFYYKENIEYMFYDTMKADTASIGLEEELKKTATILSNLAQEYEIFIGSTLQIKETSTLPINLSVQDLSSCKTVKEVLDILLMFKQIQPENFGDYEYVKDVNDEVACDLEKLKDVNDRYYACVVDKNRAGSKPKLLFKLNLAYNSWEEVGYLRLKIK